MRLNLPFPREALWELLDYHPHPGQQAFHESDARFRLLAAGARFGKSKAAAMEIVAQMAIPKSHVWIVGPTYDLASKEFRYVWDAILTLNWKTFRMVDNETNGDMIILLENGSRLQAKSWQHPTSLLGEELDLIVLAEGAQCPRKIWMRYLRARLGSRMGRLIIPTTPCGMDDFLYPLFYQTAMRGEPDYWCGQYPTAANPYHDRADIESARRELDDDEFREQYGGEFVHFAGRVFKDFERALHVVKEPFEIPAEWPRYRAIDPGFRDPFACLWAAVDGSGTVWIYREHFHRKQILSWHAAKILEASRREIIQFTVIDPSSKHTRVDNGLSILSQLAEMGLVCMPGYNYDVMERIWRISEYLRPDPATGNPGLRFFPNCIHTIEQFERYSWKANKYAGQSHQASKDVIADHDADCADCAGYLIMTRPARFERTSAVPARSFRAYRQLIDRWKRGNDVIGGEERARIMGW